MSAVEAFAIIEFYKNSRGIPTGVEIVKIKQALRKIYYLEIIGRISK